MPNECPKCHFTQERCDPRGATIHVVDGTECLRRQLAALQAELVKSKLKECADVTLSDGRTYKFCTPETRELIAALTAELAPLRRLKAAVDAMNRYTEDQNRIKDYLLRAMEEPK